MDIVVISGSFAIAVEHAGILQHLVPVEGHWAAASTLLFYKTKRTDTLYYLPRERLLEEKPSDKGE